MPSHNHTLPVLNSKADYGFQVIRNLDLAATARRQIATSTTSNVYATTTLTTAADSIGAADCTAYRYTAVAGSGKAHENVQPDYAVHFYKRLG